MPNFQPGEGCEGPALKEFLEGKKMLDSEFSSVVLCAAFRLLTLASVRVPRLSLQPAEQ